MTMIPIASFATNGTTLGFTSIPQNFVSLQIRISYTGGAGFQNIYFNGDNTNTNYYSNVYGGQNSAINLYYGNFPLIGYTTGPVNSYVVDIPDYNLTSKYKTALASFVGDNNSASTSLITKTGVLWTNTAAITSLTLSFNGSAIGATGVISLYGWTGQ